MQRADLLLANGFDQAQRLAVFTRLRHHQACTGEQRPEKLPHRHVKTERSLLQHGIVGRQPIRLLHPAQAVDQRGIGVTRAFGLAGRSGGVDHIGQVLRLSQINRILCTVGASLPRDLLIV